MDLTQFESLKEQAKTAFAERQFNDAESYYTQALAIKNCPIVLRNRALTYIHTSRFSEAEKDLFQSLRLNAQDKATLYWMGFTKLQLKKLTEATYYVGKVINIEPNFKDTESLILRAKNEYQNIVSDTVKMLSDKNVEAQAIGKLTAFGHLNGLPNTHRFMQLMLDGKTEKQEYMVALGWFWDDKKFVPLNFGEHPRKLAEFIGAGNRIATVLVQTLPIHLSKKFKDVHVFDISPGQIAFQKRILQAMQTNLVKQFADGAKQSYLDFVRQHEKAKNFSKPSIEKRANIEFLDTYQSLEGDVCPENLHVKQADIFQGLNNALETAQFDAVFLSTIPGDKETDWHAAYRHMRNWLTQGITVVHSIVPLQLLSDRWRDELLLSFDDIASKEVVTFDETVGVIHIKLTPRQN